MTPCQGFASARVFHLIERDVEDHVFLSAHHLAPSEFDKDLASVEAIVGRRFFGVAQEAGIDACIPVLNEAA